MKHKPVHILFSEAAAKLGDLPAVEHGDKSISYAVLEEKANNLGNFLVAAGAAKGTVVAILAASPAELVVAITGVLKAGCVFAPLDPGAPPKRLQALAPEISPRWYLIESRFVELVKDVVGDEDALDRIVCLDNDYTAPATHDGLEAAARFAAHFDPAPCAVETSPDAACYIYFTSGSTGRPKGIMGRLKAIDHFINWEIETFGITCGTRVSQFTTPSFDAFLRDVFVPLCAGGTVCAPPTREVVLDAARLVEWIHDSRVDLIHCVPTLFRSLLNEKLDPQHFPQLKHVLLAGEPLHVSDVKKWTDVFGERIQLVNLYGPSETTLVKFCHFVTRADLERPSIPIGRPMRGAKAMVVNARGKLCPPGIVGEIYILTPFRTLGYYGQPELTREVFVPNPLTNDADDIAYKTGDLGRILADGNFEILGRQDQQVKIMGVRVELGEIESALRGHEAVRDVAVISREEAGHNKYLCAYAVLKEGFGVEELRDYLLSRLPEAMLPSVFMKLDELPRTLTGKVDRKALPDPTRRRAGMEQPFVAPRTPVEEMLAGIWRDVLKLEQVSVHDNFFQLGGHSLLATQVISRIRQRFEVELNLHSIFRATTIVALAEAVEGRLRNGATQAAPPLTPVPRDGDLPLSFAQQRLWFLDQFEPGTSTYNVPVAAHLSGALDAEALRRCFDEVVRRHETLRTSFAVADGRPVQVVSQTARVSLPVHDLSELPADARESAARALAEEEGRRPFDLSRCPLLRACLFKLDAQEHLLIVTMHHIVSDAWSLGILLNEVTALYQAFSQGEASPLPELPIQYADFAHWQRRWLRGEVLASGLSYWKNQLSGAPTTTELLGLRTARPAQGGGGALYHFELPQTLSDRLGQLARREGVTLFMLLLAVFQTMLRHYTGQDDIVVGTPIANRNRAETEGLIGFFINTLVLRTDLSGNPSFRELLRRVREMALGAYAHQDIPFELLVEELQRERDVTRTPLVQVMFVLQNTPLSPAELPGLSISPRELHTGTSKFDLTLFQQETPGGLSCWFEYNTDLFDGGSVARMAGHFRNLVEQCVSDPDRLISATSPLSDSERRQLLADWNDTAQAYPHDLCIHQLFEARAKQSPEAVAFTSGERLLTFGELNERANQLASYLRRRRVGPDTAVGICLERSFEMVVALLGTLKAGGAYLPLDPAYPRERLAFMLEDSRAAVVLTAERLLAYLPQTSAEVLCLDREREEIAAEGRDDSPSAATPDSPAYIIYTSGSTGRPKGVAGLHRGAVNRFNWMWSAYPFKEGEVCCQKTSLNFLDSLWEIFGPLLRGVNTVLIPDEAVKDPRSLLGILERHGVTRLVLVPSLLRVLLEADTDLRGRLRKLRLCVVSGEALTPELAQRFRQLLPDCVLLNLYGSSEVSADVTAFDLGSWDAFDSTVPIGRPIGNTRIYLLDANLQPVPVGVRGDLYVGGVGLARGYLRQPALTAERFLPDAFSTEPGARLFKMGDLARYRPDGELEYLGRMDNQVKVRGFRVELGEVERALEEHAQVAQAVVAARADAAGDRRLVAYLVAHEGEEPDSDQLRHHLREKLPEYMLPSVFQLLAAMPLTPSGKVDRRLLPAPDAQGREQSHAYVPPQTPTEETLAGLCAELLGLERVGMSDNFFKLGGHSLLAMQLVSRVRQHFKLDVPVRRLFEVVTVRELAALIESEKGVDASRALGTRRHGSALVEIRPRGIRPPLFFVHSVVGNVFSYFELAKRLHPERPFYAFQSRGLDGAEAPLTDIEEMAGHYLAALLEQQTEGPYLLGGWSMGGLVAYEMARQLHASGRTVASLVVVDSLASRSESRLAGRDDAAHLSAFASSLGLNPEQFDVPPEQVMQLDFEGQLSQVLEVAKRAKIAPAGTPPDAFRQHFEVFKLNVKATNDYVPRPYAGRLHLLRAAEQTALACDDPLMGWGELATGGVELQIVPGDHYTMFRMPNLKRLAELVESCIGDAT